MKPLMPLGAAITATRVYQGLRLRAVVLADTDILAVMLLNLLDRFWSILRAIVADRTRHLTIAIDRNGIGRTVNAGARRAQDQEY